MSYFDQDNAICRKCHSFVHINVDCEWPDNKELQYCSECIYDVLESKLKIINGLKKKVKSLQAMVESYHEDIQKFDK